MAGKQEKLPIELFFDSYRENNSATLITIDDLIMLIVNFEELQKVSFEIIKQEMKRDWGFLIEVSNL